MVFSSSSPHQGAANSTSNPSGKDDSTNRYKYQSEIQAMMYTSGDVRNPLPETTQLIEDIVKSQIIEVTIQAATITQKRGSRNMIAEDLIFLIRRDLPKVVRLKEFLSWKDVRKNVKNNTGGTDDTAEIVDEEKLATKPRRKRQKLAWDFMHYLAEQLDEDDQYDDDNDTGEGAGDDLVDFIEKEVEQESMERLKEMDLLTKAMTKEQYIDYSECRQASFTYKKGKKFRDWVNLSAFIDMRPNDDILEILGFLSWELVTRLTEISLFVKNEQREQELEVKKKFSIVRGLFAPTPNADDEGVEEKTPIEVSHVREAFRRLQQQSVPLSCFKGGLLSRKIQLI